MGIVGPPIGGICLDGVGGVPDRAPDRSNGLPMGCDATLVGLPMGAIGFAAINDLFTRIFL